MERPTVKQKFEIGQIISEHCITNEQGVAVYEKGWDDERVAKESGIGVKVQTVKYMRHAIKGPLFHSKKGAKGETVAVRLDRIESYLTSKNANWKEQI